MTMVAAALAAEKKVVRRLRNQGAVSPERARELGDLTGLRRRRLTHLVRNGVVREAGPQSYDLDENAWAEHRATQRRRALFVFAIFLAAVLVIWLFAGR